MARWDADEWTSVSNFKDKLDLEVKVGDFIAYASTQGRAATLSFGLVLLIQTKPNRWVKEQLDWTIKVIGLDESQGELKFNKGVGLLSDRTRILLANNIPDQYKSILRQYLDKGRK